MLLILSFDFSFLLSGVFFSGGCVFVYKILSSGVTEAKKWMKKG